MFYLESPISLTTRWHQNNLYQLHQYRRFYWMSNVKILPQRDERTLIVLLDPSVSTQRICWNPHRKSHNAPQRNQHENMADHFEQFKTVVVFTNGFYVSVYTSEQVPFHYVKPLISLLIMGFIICYYESLMQPQIITVDEVILPCSRISFTEVLT